VTVVLRPALTLMARDWLLIHLKWTDRHPLRSILEEVWDLFQTHRLSKASL
jgi:hypothetical protein